MRTPYDLARGFIARMFGQRGAGGIRDMAAAFGYPVTLSPQDFMMMYLRNGVASRVVRSFSQATWRDYPLIRDEAGDSGKRQVKGKKNPNYSPFVEAVENFFDEHNILHYLERADRLAGVGRFGILIYGFDDGGNLDTPLPPGKHKLKYLSAYGEPRVKVQTFELNQNDIRYGLPIMYQVSPASSVSGNGEPTQGTFNVHWTRVLHLAEHLDENEVFGTPRLMPVYNHLLDLEKVVGSGAETYWLNARGGMSITADADADIDPKVLEDMKNQAEEFEHQLRRIIALQGAKAEILQTSVADPKSNVEASLQLIAGGTGIPLRILIGSERGELSSAQDENNWAARIDERQENYGTPRVLKPFVRKMIETGNFPAPNGLWWIEWPTSASISPTQLAEISLKKAQALATYANSPGALLIVPEQEFRVNFLDLLPESEYDQEEEDEDDLTDPEAGDIETIEGEEVEEPLLLANGDRIFGHGLTAYRLKANAAPRTLYVHRKVLNGEAIRAHFRAQGIDPMTPADDMHVTIAYSKTPVDWFRIEPIWDTERAEKLEVPAGGARMMSLFGKEFVKNVLVLQFSSSHLSWRFEDFKRAGASWDWPDYEPHITITYDVVESWGKDSRGNRVFAESVWDEKLKALEPYQGPIELGPEIFSEIVEDWGKNLTENARV